MKAVPAAADLMKLRRSQRSREARDSDRGRGGRSRCLLHRCIRVGTHGYERRAFGSPTLRELRRGRRPGRACRSSARSAASARNAIVSAISRGLGPACVVGLRHRLAVRRRVDSRWQHRVDQDVLAEQLGRERLGQRRDAGLRGHVARSSRPPARDGPRRDVDDAAALAGLAHRAAPPRGSARKQVTVLSRHCFSKSASDVSVILRHREAADEVNRRPQRRAAPRRTRRRALRRRARRFGRRVTRASSRHGRCAGSSASIIGTCTVAPRASSTSTTPGTERAGAARDDDVHARIITRTTTIRRYRGLRTRDTVIARRMGGVAKDEGIEPTASQPRADGTPTRRSARTLLRRGRSPTQPREPRISRPRVPPSSMAGSHRTPSPTAVAEALDKSDLARSRMFHIFGILAPLVRARAVDADRRRSAARQVAFWIGGGVIAVVQRGPALSDDQRRRATTRRRSASCGCSRRSACNPPSITSARSRRS